VVVKFFSDVGDLLFRLFWKRVSQISENYPFAIGDDIIHKAIKKIRDSIKSPEWKPGYRINKKIIQNRRKHE
jgi:hypothetical protein